MTKVDYLELLRLAAPETIVAFTALVVLAADLLALREVSVRFRLVIGGLFSALGVAAAIVWLLVFPQHAQWSGGMLVTDPLTGLVKMALGVLAILTIVIALDSDFTTHVGEFLALVLMATVGMMFLVSAEDLLMIFIALELTSLSLYVLTAFDKRNAGAAEAALKYFLLGGASAAVMLFGLSLLYGLAGTTQLRGIAAAVAGPKLDPILVMAMVFTMAGFGFKVAAAPFHLWAPDVYQGAPAPSAALVASGSKLAGFIVLAKVMTLGFAGAEGSGALGGYVAGWVPLLAGMAAISMVLGNVAALVQNSVRRLLAYSAIAHAGYMLLGVIAGKTGLVALAYYAVTYGLTTVGAFGVVSVVERQSGGDKLTDFAGLSRRAPVLSLCMLVFLLSLAGIPPLAGFFGKFYLFASALGQGPGRLGLLWLVALGVGMSVVSLYYYLQILKQIYVREEVAGAQTARTPVFSGGAIILAAAGVVALGCAPDLLVSVLARAVKLAAL